MHDFRAIRVSQTATGQTVATATLTEADLMPGDVTVDVHYSSMNYKDGLAITGKGPIIRTFPLIPGVDFTGVVRSSTHSRFKRGDAVIMGGWGVGEGHHGGFSQVARVDGDWLVPLPAGLSLIEAAGIGVAGFTAMLCVMALEEQGVTPGHGEFLVTGAAGGVGSISIALLSGLGFRVVASTGRTAEKRFLETLGAADVIDREIFNGPLKPLAKARWAGAVDSVGSITLANVLSQIIPEGAVAACGLAQGMDLPASVAPFILRGVRLIGINSVTTPLARRQAAWARLAHDLDKAKLMRLTRVVGLDDVMGTATDIVQGKVKGRVVVDVNR